MSQLDAVQHLLKFYLDYHLERLPKNDPLLLDLFKLIKNSNICDDDENNSESDFIVVGSDWLIGILERLVIDENGSCGFSSDSASYPYSWLWRVLCMNEEVTYENEEIIRDAERERQDSDLVEIGEWLLQNARGRPNEIYKRDRWESYHILYVCAKGGSLDKVRLLKGYGADVNEFSELRFYHERPISVAFRNQFFNVVKELCSGNYSELLDASWYELRDGFEYNCVEMLDLKKGLEPWLDFFSHEYVASSENNESILQVIEALQNRNEEGIDIWEIFNEKCEHLKRNSLAEKLFSQRGNRLHDLEIICQDDYY